MQETGSKREEFVLRSSFPPQQQRLRGLIDSGSGKPHNAPLSYKYSFVVDCVLIARVCSPGALPAFKRLLTEAPMRKAARAVTS